MLTAITFEEALKLSEDGNRHVLLGNGFSIDCRPDIFLYGKLFEQASFDDIPRAREVFRALSSTDFERVIKALRDFAVVAHIYSGSSVEAASDADVLKEVLVRTIAKSHPARPADIKLDEYAWCKRFLSNFNRIFTVNYDLLLYWALMHEEIEPEVSCDDGFRKPVDDYEASYVTWEPEKSYEQNVYYLHGALHLFDAGTELQKYTWINTGIPLIEQIREALSRNYFPLFVAEGSSSEKYARIRHSDYLAKAYRSFLPITGSLFIHGHSLAPNDEHVLNAIGKGRTDRLFIGLHGDPNSDSNKLVVQKALSLASLRRSKRHSLKVDFYMSETAHVWR
jgi:hypothetical protein